MNPSTEIKGYHLYPLAFILAVVPLIVYLKATELTGAGYEYWTGTPVDYDFYTYYKGIWLISAGLLALGVYLVKLLQSRYTLIKGDLRTYHAALGVYLILMIASTLFSEHVEIAREGFPNNYEGAHVLFAYMLVLFLTINLTCRDSHYKLLCGALFSGAAVIGIIGLFQYLGYDFMMSKWGKFLMLPEEYAYLADSLRSTARPNTIYATLFQQNYVGSYAAMLVPLCASLFLLAKERRVKILLGCLLALMEILWFGCYSRAGLVGGILAFLMLLLVLNKQLLRYKWSSIIVVVLTLALFFGMNHLSAERMASRQFSLVEDAQAFIGTGVNPETLPAYQISPLKDLVIRGNTATLTTTTETLSIVNQDRQLFFRDQAGNSLQVSYDPESKRIQIADPLYKDYVLLLGEADGKVILKLTKKSIILAFELTKEGILLKDNKARVVDLNPQIEKWGFEGKELLGSSRAYIWSRSIPLLKNTYLLGYGPDTFAIYFPQHDFWGKNLALVGHVWNVVEKPHNLYLQIALQTGIPSLIALLVVFGLYSIKSIRLYYGNSFEDFLPRLGVSIFFAIVGYLGAGFFNDSNVSVAPVFWILLGLGISINHTLSRRTTSTRGLLATTD